VAQARSLTEKTFGADGRVHGLEQSGKLTQCERRQGNNIRVGAGEGTACRLEIEPDLADGAVRGSSDGNRAATPGGIEARGSDILSDDGG
jgi:hypothetical protein